MKQFIVASFLSLAFASSAFSDSTLSIPVALRPGVSSTVAVTVRENPTQGRPCIGRTVAFVHGLTHTASTWNPLVEEIFAGDNNRGICKVALIDLPGHGQSPAPSGVTYGELLVDDYVTALVGALDGLRNRNVRPAALVGHSMGGLVIEAAQTRLLASGSSFARKYGIFVAALLSPVPAAEHPWQFAESGAAAATVGSFVTTDPDKGPVVRLDPASWSFFFLTNFSDVFSPGTPSAASITAQGFNNDEAAYAASQLVGAAPFSRPSVTEKAFALRHGTVLFLINPNQDKFSLRPEAQAAYLHLTGDATLRGFVAVDDAHAVHDMHIAQPRLFLSKALGAFLSNLD